ncbi:MAG: hypothetical protein Q8P89_00680 [bacterium]|nr:hypothetical protein [bacterium]
MVFSKYKYLIGGLVILLVLVVLLSGSGRGEKTAQKEPAKPAQSVALPTPTVDEMSVVIAEGKVKSVTSQELVLEKSGKTQKFKVTPETKIVLLAPPAKPGEVKIADLKAGDGVSLVYKNVSGDLVAQLVTATREE